MLVPCNIDDVWSLVRRRALPWLDPAEGGEKQFLEECRSGRSLAWRSQEVLVVLSLVPAHGREKDLFVRAMVSLAGSNDVGGSVLVDVEKIARDLGANRIRFRSARAGFLRALDSRWRVAFVEYAMDVRPSA
jgi:hypothetical protein